LVNDEKFDENKSQEFLNESKKLTNQMVTLYALPYIHKKFMNVFIYYITYFSKFQNSYIIKKLENLKNSSNYKKREEEIDTSLNVFAVVSQRC